MGSEQHFKRSRREPRAGKVEALLDAKLKGVEWGEFRIGDLFEKINLRFKKSIFDKGKDISKTKSSEFNLPLVNAKDGDNGIMYYGREKDFESIKMSIDIVNDGAISTGNVYSQPQKTGVLYNAYLIKPKFDVNEISLHFLTSTTRKSIKHKFGYENKAGWIKVKTEKIQLPTKNNKIDFEFMENFIAELEAQKIARLEAYLVENGLKEYCLSDEEEAVLKNLSNIEFQDFQVVDIFDVRNSGNILSRDIVVDSGDVPYLCASSENNAVSSYISYDDKYLDKGDCVFIGGKTFVVTYQEKDFYSNDSHNLILHLKEKEDKNKLTQLFLATCVNKSLGYKYSWGDSISNRKIQKDTVSLPTKNNQPDYALMKTLISAVQKLVVKDVVLYVEGKRS